MSRVPGVQGGKGWPTSCAPAGRQMSKQVHARRKGSVARRVLNREQFGDRNVEARKQSRFEGLPIAQQPLLVGGPNVDLAILMVYQPDFLRTGAQILGYLPAYRNHALGRGT